MASYRIVPLLFACLLLSATICVNNAAPSELVVSNADAALTGIDAPNDITVAIEIVQTTTEEVLEETTTITLPVTVEDGTEGSGEGSETTTTPAEVTEEPTTITNAPAEVTEEPTTTTNAPAEVTEEPTTTTAAAISSESTTVAAVETTTTSVVASTEPESTSTTAPSTTKTTTTTSTTTSTTTTEQPETTEAATTEEPQPAFVCPGAGKFEDPENCRRYYSCAINVLTPGVYQQQALDCPPSNAYSAEHGRCTRDLASCTDDGFTCSTIGKFGDPTGADETFYYWCLATLRGGFHKYRVRCASGERFQPILGGCWRDDWTIGGGWGIGAGVGLEDVDIAAIKMEMKQFKAEEKLKQKAAKEQQKLLLKQQKALEKAAKKAAKEAAKQAAKLAEAPSSEED